MNATLKNLASLLSTLTLGLGLSLVGTGCVVDGTATVVTHPTPVADVTIDTGASLHSKPGDGVGFFVEYAELIELVWACERQWMIDDRIDAAIKYGRPVRPKGERFV